MKLLRTRKAALRRFRVIRSNILKQKVFCIGLNKTGTTSLRAALEEIGFVPGDEARAKYLSATWAKRDFGEIVRFCRTAEAFFDSPFSLPFTYVILDQYYPGSKFILTIRDTPEEWYNSITKYHAKLWGKGKVLPSAQDLKEAVNVYKGRPYEMNRMLFNTPEEEPYQKGPLIHFYQNHLYNVSEYFKFRQKDFIVINLKINEDYKRLCNFLGVRSIRDRFPRLNVTADVIK
jgi:hypothetical protein